jgi:hypothetical protein
VPQLVQLGGVWRALFSAWRTDHSTARLARPGVVAEGGTHYLVAEAQLGPYVLDRDAFLLADPQVSFTPAGPCATGGCGGCSPGGTSTAKAGSSASSATRCP